MEAARAARVEDGERVALLRSEAHQALLGTRGAGLLIAEQAARDVPWATWIDDPTRLAVVGTLDHHLVGYGLARLAQVGRADLIGVVDEVWVEAGARGVGVGEAVMTAILEWCRETGCSGIDGQALPGDRVMKGFFERYGLSARLLVMHRSLPSAGSGLPGSGLPGSGLPGSGLPESGLPGTG